MVAAVRGGAERPRRRKSGCLLCRRRELRERRSSARGGLSRAGDAIKALVSGLHQFSNDSKVTLVDAWQRRIGSQSSMRRRPRTPAGLPLECRRRTSGCTLRAVGVGRLDADGKITELRDYADRLDLFTQLGLLKAPGA